MAAAKKTKKKASAVKQAYATVEAKPSKGAKKPKGELNIPPLNLAEMTIRVGGDILVCHRFPEKARKEIRDKKLKIAKPPRGVADPEAEYKAAKYLDAKGRDCVPTCAFRKAIIAAGRYVEGITLVKLRGLVFPKTQTRDKDGNRLVLLNYDKEEMREDIIRVANGNPDIRWRPQYTNWWCDLTLVYDPDNISAEQVANLVARAGFHVGICENRPEKEGEWGQFSVTGAADKKARFSKVAKKRLGRRPVAKSVIARNKKSKKTKPAA